MSLYLSGPMRGFPLHNYPLFNEVANKLRQQGYEVVNPAEISTEGVPRETCMLRDLKVLLGCESVAVLPGWEMSPGAGVEVATAWALNKPLFDVRFTDGQPFLSPSSATGVIIPRETQYYEKVPLVGFCGYAQVGKDTAAQPMVENGWTRVGFADLLKEMLLALDPLISENVRLVRVINDVGWDRAKGTVREVRLLLQRLGSEGIRNTIDSNLLVAMGERKIEAINGPVVISDCRFPNELQMIRRRGGKIIWVNRPGFVAMNGHVSENSVGPDDCDLVIANDGSVERLRVKVYESLMQIVPSATMYV